jgi:K+-transporting ATPase KdpF subunit
VRDFGDFTAERFCSEPILPALRPACPPAVISLRDFYVPPPILHLDVMASFAGLEIEVCHGSDLSGRCHRTASAQRRARRGLRGVEEAAMNWLYVLSGVLAVAVFAYLVVALLWPEKF